MESSAAGVAARGVALPVTSSSSHPSRKQWRAVPEQSGGNSNNGELERVKLVQSDERLIYEVQQGREPADVDFCSITIDGGLHNNDILQQRLQSVVKQKEELEQMEIELKAQLIARTEILEMQKTFDVQITEHANANIKLQEQLRERENKLHELERKMEEKERELHAIRLDNEAAWVKEGLFREQSKELQTYRRDLDNSEAERAQHMKQMHDLQEHIQDKERQFIELQEQNRIAQESILFKDEQLREAQAWITRVQEMDVLQSSATHSLQAELRDRNDQYNQLWLGCQRQFAEMERFHLHIQQLQIELADARERSGNINESSQLGQVNVSGSSGNSVNLVNGNAENASAQSDGTHGVQIAPSSILNLPSYLPAGQVGPLHHPLYPSHTHVSHFHSIPAMSALQQWHSQQVVASEGPHMHTLNQYPQQTEYEAGVNGQGHPLDVNISQGVDPTNTISSSKEEREVFGSTEQNYQSQESMQEMSSQFQDALRLNSLEHSNVNKEKIVNHLTNPQGVMSEQPRPLQSEEPVNAHNSSSAVIMGEKAVAETLLLDERSLLACIVRTIPPGTGGKIRISSTLPNRLAKMLAPLHWHDYKKKYGKLEEFIGSHPELFIVDGELIELREGAKEMIAATAAVAKVAAAAAANANAGHSSSVLQHSVAVTPMSQSSNRLKKAIDNNNSTHLYRHGRPIGAAATSRR